MVIGASIYGGVLEPGAHGNIDKSHREGPPRGFATWSHGSPMFNDALTKRPGSQAVEHRLNEQPSRSRHTLPHSPKNVQPIVHPRLMLARAT